MARKRYTVEQIIAKLREAEVEAQRHSTQQYRAKVPQDETALAEDLDRPLVVTRYPANIKAFYMQPDAERADRVLCVDILAPEGYGEIVGGGQRIHDLALLQQRLKEHDLPEDAFQWYLDLRRYGSVPHSGFGLGL